MSEPADAPYGLIVDDDAVILMDAAQILQDAGFRTLTAIDAQEALDLLQCFDGAVTVLFTDVEMPGAMNGFGLAQAAAARWPSIAIMVASGRSTPRDGDLPDGAHFIRKPFSAALVHERLQALLPDGRKPDPLRRKA